MNSQYQRGDVILVELPFTDGPGGKKRPAVVLSTPAFNNAGIKLIAIAITTNLDSPFRPGDVTLSEWQAAGLLKPSAIRGYLGMADQRHVERILGKLTAQVERILGKLTAQDFAQVEQAVASIIGLSVSASR